MSIYLNYQNTKGKNISLTTLIAKSGEGEIWETNINRTYAKIYHNPTQEKADKLKVMLANPPQTANQKQPTLAWPNDLVIDNSGQCVGFLMPAITDSEEIICAHNTFYRNQNFPHFNWFVLHCIALNISLILDAIHAKGYVVGDMKPANILLNKYDPNISFIDADSFQVKDANTNKVYHCPVGSVGFTPPELIGKNLSTVTQESFHDYFRLGVMIHLLLFGYDPYTTGTWKGWGATPSLNGLTLKGFWVYGQNSRYRPGSLTMPFNIIHPELQNCFRRCFEIGHHSPQSRPTPQDWIRALESAINDLKVCSQVNNHIYSESYGKCYWCDRSKNLQVDIFPLVSNPIKPKPINLNLPPIPLQYTPTVIQPKTAKWINAVAIISTVATLGLGILGYQQYQYIQNLKFDKSILDSQKRKLQTELNQVNSQVNKLSSEVDQLNNLKTSLSSQNNSLNSNVTYWKDKFYKIQKQTEAQISKNQYIIYTGGLSSSNTSNIHVFWVDQQGQYFFNLYDLSTGGDADFVILNENYSEIQGTTRNNTGTDSLTFNLSSGTYFVKVYISGSTATSYKMGIYKY